MRIAACFFPSRGHINLLVPLIETLIDLGHEVDIYGSPSLVSLTGLPEGVRVFNAGLPTVLTTLHVQTCHSQLRSWLEDNKPWLLGSSEPGDAICAEAQTTHRFPRDTFAARFRSLDFDSVCRAMTAIRFFDDIKAAFKARPPDLVLHDSNERGSFLLADLMQIPTVTVPSRADFFSPSYSQHEDRLLSFFGLGYAQYTKMENLVAAVGPRQLYGDEVQPGRHFIRYEPSRLRLADTKPLDGVDALFSFGTFLEEPPLSVLEDLLMELIATGRSRIVLKLRDTTLGADLQRSSRFPASAHIVTDMDILRYGSPGTLFIGHGSLTASMEALWTGCHLKVIPSDIADHGWVAACLARMQWSSETYPIDRSGERSAASERFCEANDSESSLGHLLQGLPWT